MQVRVKPHPQFSAIYLVTLEDGTQRLATKNLTPGKNVYGEKLIRHEGVEYRLWDPFRSKLAAAILKNLMSCSNKTWSQRVIFGSGFRDNSKPCLRYCWRRRSRLLRGVCTTKHERTSQQRVHF